MTHLTTESILRLVDAEEHSDLDREHLRECRFCSAEAERLERLVGFMATDAANEPPTDVVDWAAGLFQPMLRLGAPATEGREGIVGRVARLVFDSFEQPLAAGVRSAPAPGPLTRKLLYRAGDVDIDVRVETAADNKVSLSGQVLSNSTEFFENAPVRLESGGESRFETATNPIGEFAFDGIPSDTYHLSMELPSGPVTLFCVYRDHLRN